MSPGGSGLISEPRPPGSGGRCTAPWRSWFGGSQEVTIVLDRTGSDALFMISLGGQVGLAPGAPADRDSQPVRKFGAFTVDLEAIAERRAEHLKLPGSRNCVGSSFDIRRI